MDKQTNEFKAELASAKSLRWLANMFPDDKGTDESSKMCRCIHLYATYGADAIDSLVRQLNEYQLKEQAIAKTVASGSVLCSICKNRKGWETCKPCRLEIDPSLVDEED